MCSPNVDLVFCHYHSMIAQMDIILNLVAVSVLIVYGVRVADQHSVVNVVLKY